MCMCGGVIEIGLIAAAVGYIGKRLHKCKCQCHEEHNSCPHCEKTVKIELEDHKILIHSNKNKNRRMIYTLIQFVLGALIIGGIAFAAFGLYNEHNEHHHHHNHTEVQK